MSKRTFQRVITQHVHPGSLIWTDSHKSYQWLERPDSGFYWQSINHRRAEFARREGGVNISTNAIEGLFHRMKATFRHLHVSRVSKRRYGPLLAEYLFRARYFHHNAEWRDGGLWVLCKTLVEEFPPARWVHQMHVPIEFREQWDALKEATRSAVFPQPDIPIPALRVVPPPAPVAVVPPPAPVGERRVFQRLTRHDDVPQIDVDADSDIEVAEEQEPAADIPIPFAELDPPRVPILPMRRDVRCNACDDAMRKQRITPELHADWATTCDRCARVVRPRAFAWHCEACDFSLCCRCARG